MIEDASHAIGGSYRDLRVGSCRHSDLAVFSFHPVKLITTGEGGMILTNRQDLYEKLLRLRTHGITRDPRQMKGAPEGAWYYEQVELGFNYRMTDVQAALGASQLKRLDRFVEKRNALVRRYNEGLAGLPVRVPELCHDIYSAFHLYVIRLNLDEIQRSRAEVFEALRADGVGVNVHYIPIHLQPYYRALGFKRGDFPEAESYYDEAITLPLYPDLTDADQARVIASVKKAVQA